MEDTRVTTPSPQPMPSAADEALGIEEIQHRILLLADKATQAMCARVCRDWFEPATHVLWEDVPFRAAVQVLGPLSWHRPPGRRQFYTLSRGITPEDWERFFVYASHVRCIRSGGEASDTVAAMALSRPVLHIFPKLRRVLWKVSNIRSLVDSVLVMSPSSTQLELSVDDAMHDAERFHFFCQEIRSRLPHLTLLEMGGDLLDSACSVSLIGLVSTLQDLEKFRATRYGLTPRLLLALSRLPKLQRIQAATGNRLPPAPERVSELETIDTSALGEGAFCSLEYLRLPTNFRNVRNLLEHAHGPRSLVRFICDALHHESPIEIRHLLTSIAAACPQLTSLTLICVPANKEEAQPIPCTWESLRPVLRCRLLVDFYIRHVLPVQLTMSDIEELASDRPTWTKIAFAPFPAFDLSPRPSLGFSAIIPFARHCPRLETLGLFIDGDLPLPKITPEAQFLSLTQFELGFSPISERNMRATAWLLAGICVRPVTIETEWKGSPVVPTPYAELETRASRWKRVQELQNEVCNLPWIVSLREENRKLRKRDNSPNPERRFGHSVWQTPSLSTS